MARWHKASSPSLRTVLVNDGRNVAYAYGDTQLDAIQPLKDVERWVERGYWVRLHPAHVRLPVGA